MPWPSGKQLAPWGTRVFDVRGLWAEPCEWYVEEFLLDDVDGLERRIQQKEPWARILPVADEGELRTHVTVLGHHRPFSNTAPLEQ